MKKFNSLLLLLTFCTMYSQQFTNTSELPGVLYGNAMWINTNGTTPEYQLIINGFNSDYTRLSNSYFYENNQFESGTITTEPIGYAAVDSFDVNQDGYTDFIIAGSTADDNEAIYLYVNDGTGSYNAQNLSFPGITTGKLKTGDFNNDGYDDFIITGVSGFDYIAKLYLSNGDTTFSEAVTPFFGNSYGNITVFDANNDGSLDVLLTGFSNSYAPETRLYLNDGSAVFTENTDTGIEGIYFSGTSAADYNNDGNIDLIVSGMDTSYTPFTALYINDGSGNFTFESSDFAQLYFGTTDFVDYNNDGQTDIFITGTDADNNVHSLLYKNENGSFTEDTASNSILEGVYTSSSNWTDFDGDGDLDLTITGLNSDMNATTKVYINTIADVPPYCIPEFNFPDSPAEPITLVQFNTINNTSSAAINNDISLYEDFSSISTTVEKGSTYTLTVKGNTNGDETNYITVFIDWNQDNTFSSSLSNNEKYQSIPALVNSNGEDEVSVTYEITIPAEALTGNTRMRVMKNYQAPAPHPCSSAGTFGQVEDYTLTVTEETAVICEGTDPDEEIGSTGCISFTYNGTDVQYTTVRAADGSIWLQQNLGSSQVGASATDENAFGDLFQWGRWADGHQKRDSEVATTAPSPNNPSGLGSGSTKFYGSEPQWWANTSENDKWEAVTPNETDEYNGCDPCRILGEDWHLPTQVDWQSVLESENVEDIATAYSSNLKLVVAGSRSSSGDISNAGVRGYYWSSTISDSNIEYSKYLYYSNYIINPNAGGLREQGFSLRCVKSASVLVVDTPVATEATDVTTTGFTANWESVTNADNYILEVSTTEDFSSFVTGYEAYETETTSTVLTGLDWNTTYYYRLKAVNGEVISVYSNVISVTTPCIEIEAPQANAEQQFCNSATVEDLTAITNDVIWYNSDNGDTVLNNNEPLVNGTYYAAITENGCESTRTEVTVTIITAETPEGESEQELIEGGTLAEIEVTTGDDNEVVWYSDAELTTEIEATTVAQNNVTYYAATSLGNCISEPLAVTVSIILSNDSFATNSLKVYPNPVSDILTVSYNEVIDSITIYNMMGQVVIKEKSSSNTIIVNTSNLTAGTYLVRITSGNNNKVIRVIKN